MRFVPYRDYMAISQPPYDGSECFVCGIKGREANQVSHYRKHGIDASKAIAQGYSKWYSRVAR